MPLWDPAREPAVPPEDAVVVVHDFLERCARWAEEREIPKRLADLGEDPRSDAAARLHAWTTYLEFTRHALRELEDGRLDAWFHDADPPRPAR